MERIYKTWVFNNLNSYKYQFITCNSFIGPIDPKRPADAFALQLWFLKRLGLWAPDTDDQLVQSLYTIWSYFYRWFFLYTYTATQILFFLKVEDLAVNFWNFCINSFQKYQKLFKILFRTSLKDFSFSSPKSLWFTRSRSSTAIVTALKLVRKS